MHLFQAKTAGHHVVKNSGWFGLHKKYTLLLGNNGAGKTAILRALHGINPVSGQALPNPFDDYPEYYHTQGHPRKVLPDKKTGGFAVYVCTPQLRTALVDLDPVFLETDRIEVGRRFDFSKWITFVEISSSSRWSEAAPLFEQLHTYLQKKPEARQLLKEYDDRTALAPTDRLKDDTMHWLGNWLNAISGHITAPQRKTYDRARFIVYRAKRFQQARRVVNDHLPHHIYLDESLLLPARMRLDQNVVTASANINNSVMLQINKQLGVAENTRPGNDVLDGFSRRLHWKMKHLYPALPVHIKCRLQDTTLLFFVLDGQHETPLDQGPSIYRWLATISLFLLLDVFKIRPAIFFLDEPDFAETDITLLKQMLESIAEHHQLVVASKRKGLVDNTNFQNVRLLEIDAERAETTVRTPKNIQEIESFG